MHFTVSPIEREPRGISRAVQRGSKLLPTCRRAKISKHEYGQEDNRCFCYGIFDDWGFDICEECTECGAYVDNAKPIEAADDGE